MTPSLRPLSLAALLLLGALLPAGPAAAEAAPAAAAVTSSPPAARPRIALALSGGGARGAAHVGVLKMLEALRVPVDCVAGTSMGSIIGGLYAAGSDAAQIEAAIADIDWDGAFDDHPPRAEIAIRSKMGDLKGLAAPEFGVRDGELAAPKGLVTGISIEHHLRRLTRSAADVRDFDALPLPFRAVAADIETGAEVVLDRGSLAQALRASMSIPGVMAPVEADGRLLVDGGIANNLPIDIARRLCGDVVIAVNIQTPLLTRAELSSALSVSAQLINLLGKSSVDRQIAGLRPGDVLITPDLIDITAASFERQREAIEMGAAAAGALATQLLRYSVDEAAYATHLAARRERQHATATVAAVDAITFDGLQRTNAAVLADLLKSRPGTELDERTLAADIRRIYGRGDFEGVDYRIASEGGVRNLRIMPREKSWGPDYLRFGLGLASDFSGDSDYSLLASYRQTWLNKLGGEWLTDLRIGRRNGIATEFYQPLDEAGRLFVAPHLQAQNDKHAIFLDGDRIAEYRSSELRAGLDVGINFGTTAMLRIGPLWRNTRLERDTGPSVLPDEFFQRSHALRTQLFIDQTDRAWLPRAGYLIDLNALRTLRQRGDGEALTRLEGRGDLALSADAHTLNLSLSGGAALGGELAYADLFALGGPLRLSSYRIGELRGERYALLKAEYYNRRLRLPALFGNGVYLGTALEVGQVGEMIDGTDSGIRYSVSVFFAADTAFGPTYLGLAGGDNGEARLYFMLGAP